MVTSWSDAISSGTVALSKPLSMTDPISSTASARP